MAKTTVLHIRVEPEVKIDVESTLSKLGISTTDAINIFLKQVVMTGGIPFDIKIPNYNYETEMAMKEAREISKIENGFTNTSDLFKELDS
ncbi:MAG: type II toxin-antitoxin system RelB/DinJ family antitoxin [Clostridiales bacterium]|nr:type II toxin-antitoxin system RelB/DinJ family antitoxin [Clostridiales bacterium]